ncbi:MAG TPA: NmrA/HSCARG family protein, partial [Gammaproteobacteria bacterium]|nr:NmrA/HSCARG family protein [Gammaproteobacteria bacterium]
MGNAKMAGIAAEDIGKTAYGIFKAGSEYIGKTVGILGEALTVEQMGNTISKVLGVGPVTYNAVEADAYRAFGFPGADELGNMFQAYRDFEKQMLANRNLDTAKKLNPSLQSFEQFVTKQKNAIVSAMGS